MTKNEIRLKMKGLRDGLSLSERIEQSDKIRRRLFETKVYQDCSMIFSYLSFRSEVNTMDIIKTSMTDGKRVFLPKVEGKQMEFYEIHDLQGLINSQYGILEPQATEENRYQQEASMGIASKTASMSHWNVMKDKLMLLPSLAVDKKGNRIGYGAGYYDRYLYEHGNENIFYKIALAYDIQVMDEVEADTYDIKVDAILTPTKLINCQKL